MRIGLNFGGVASLEAQVQHLDEQVQRAVDAENDGFDSVWFAQIFGHDALTIIALAGAKTKRIELGTGVVPTFPRHPFVLAQQALTVQAATASRFTLGIGLSHQPVVESMWGLSYEKPARHMKEYLGVLMPLLRDGRVTFSGDLYLVGGALQIPGVTTPSVLIAALAQAMLRTAGELTDGTVTWMTGPKTLATHIVPRINAAATKAGRPAPRVAVALPVAVADDPTAAWERATQEFQVYGQLPNYRRMLDIEGAKGPGEVAIVGNEADVERQLRELAGAGATDFSAAMYPVGDDALSSLARTRALLKELVGKV